MLGRPLASLVATLALASFALPQGPEGTAVVRGRVIDGLTGQPLRNIVVRFSPRPRGPYLPGIDPEPPSRSVITGPDGMFEMPRLVAADYAINGSGPGDFLSIEYGSTKAGGGKLLTVADGATLDIVMQAWRGAAIAGHVFDERGRPIAGVQLRAYEKASDTLGVASTNDLGAYEIARLKPGTYTVGVTISLSSRTLNRAPAQLTPSSYPMPLIPFVLDRASRTVLIANGAPLPASADDGRSRVYLTSFAGGASTKAGARYLRLGAGDTRGNIDITLPAVRGTRVAGVVTAATGVTGTILTLLPADGSRAQDTGWIDATAASDGSFAFIAVPPGRYVLTAHRRVPPLTEVTLGSAGPAIAWDDVIGHDSEDAWAEMPFTVSDADVDDLAVTLTPGTPLSGHVVAEADGGSGPPGTQARIWLVRDESTQDDRHLQLARDGSFSTRIRPGAYRIFGGGNAPDRVFKTAVVNGQDIGDGPLMIGADPITDIRLVIGRYDTTLRGSVTDAGGNPASSASVLIFPANNDQRLRLQESSSRWRVAQATNGVFQASGLQPGDYLAIAVADYRTAISADHAAWFSAQATRVTLRESTPAAVNLSVKDPE